MDSAKIFALGLAAGLAIHVFVRNNGKAQSAKKEVQESIATATKSSKKNKNKKKIKDTTSAPAPAPEKKPELVKQPEPGPAPALAPVAVATKEEPAAPATASKKNKKKNKTVKKEDGESYAAVAAEETEKGINDTAIRAKSDAIQTTFTASLGDMRDDQVDPLPAGYDSFARIPAPEVEASKPKLSQKERDEGWSNVRSGPSSSANGAKLNGASSNKPNGASNGIKASIASNNPFAALPDDAPTSSFKRLPSSNNSTTKSNAAANGWTVASASSKPKNNSNTNVVGAGGVETKRQRSNANKNQAKKAAKEGAERLQAERLANHRRQQALEAMKQKEAARRPQPSSANVASAKAPTAQASVDLNGRLVWD
ncbi:uncharacterized protein UBRO_06494 [Ustilago bromivora]|uniref:Uncharacterized protein n=1 Tax=Ustilago bromivora TaxID=307758 RepID=A0A1K0G7V6_9BASI|nr:uncharacterized protein UBRO_06494 [Ustilago bromivora]SYW80454.1 uncharacterized protein UBRO2_03722 [Ustilago bromivora]